MPHHEPFIASSKQNKHEFSVQSLTLKVLQGRSGFFRPVSGRFRAGFQDAVAALQDGKAEAVQLEKLRADVASAARFEVSCGLCMIWA